MRARLALVLALAAVPLAGCLSPGLVGKPTPRFELVDSLGERVNESSYAGRYVVLDLMATWCAPCRLEVGHLQDVQRAYGDRVAILSIGVDPTESDAQLDAFAREHGATWAHGLDRNGSIGRAFGLGIIPKLVVLDPAGTVVLDQDGEVLPAAIARAVDPAGAPPEERAPSVTFAVAVLAAALGFLATMNPYRQPRPRGGPWLALALFALLALAAWRYAGLVSTRATYGSLGLGLVTLAAAAWWWRARTREPTLRPELAAAPHFALALVLGLSTTGLVGAFAPLAAFLVGLAAGERARPRLDARRRVVGGLVGLTLAGAGLLAFGARILL